jgi:FeS assembly SUF system protein
MPNTFAEEPCANTPERARLPSVMRCTGRPRYIPYIIGQETRARLKMTAQIPEGTPLIRPSTTDHPLYDLVVEACKSVYDPEIPVNVFDLGLIYTIEINDENAVDITMTLTAPGCPVAGEMPGWVADAIEPLAGVKHVDVQMTFDPQWGMDMMTDEARLELGFM